MADDPRRMLLEVLLDKIDGDQYPSIAMLDVIEELLLPEEVPEYVELLVQRFSEETYPSMPLLRRIAALT